MPHERPDAEHDARIDAGDGGREQAVDHGAADDDVDVVQPVPQDRDGHRRRDAEHLGEPGGRVRGRGQPGLAAGEAQQGDEQGGGEPYGGQGEPLDLLAQQAAAGPVPDGERDERGHQERQEHRREPVHRAGQDRGRDRAGIVHRQRVREAQRDPAGGGELDQPGMGDQAGRGQPSQHQAGRGHRPPAPRRQGPGREEQEHERDREDDGGEAALGERAHLLCRRERPRERRDPDHRVRRSNREKRLRRARAQHEPADDVAGPADDERAERGVRRGRGRQGQVPGQVAVGQVAGGHEGQGQRGERGHHGRGPQRGDESHARRRREVAYRNPAMPSRTIPSRACRPP